MTTQHVLSPSSSKYVHSEELERMAGETWKKKLPHCTAYALLRHTHSTLFCIHLVIIHVLYVHQAFISKTKKNSRKLPECAAFTFIYTTLHPSQNDTCGRLHVHGSNRVRVGTITGLDYWTHPNCKSNSFSAEQKLNVLIPSVTSWSFQRSKVTCILISFNFGGYT